MVNEKHFRDPTKMIRLIDADAEIEAIKKYACNDCESYDGIKCRSCWADDLISWIEDAPKLDAVEVVHGRWEDCSDKDEIGMNLRCVVCGGRADSFVGGTEDWYCLWKPNFCPHCGAKMDGDGNGT